MKLKASVLFPFSFFLLTSVSAAVPFKLGVARYTVYKQKLDDALRMMQRIDYDGTTKYGPYSFYGISE